MTEEKNKPIQTIAAFDFDGTLTYRDTLLPFFAYSCGLPKTAWKLLIQSPCLLQLLTGYATRQEIKEKFLTRFFRGMPIEYLRAQGEAFAKGPLMEKLRPEALNKLRWHQEKGHRCILVSANLDIYLHPWHKLMGFNDLICSVVEEEEGRITGKLRGENCWGPVKRERIKNLLGTENHYLLYAYGDSRGDEELLEMADFPFYNSYE